MGISNITIMVGDSKKNIISSFDSNFSVKVVLTFVIYIMCSNKGIKLNLKCNLNEASRKLTCSLQFVYSIGFQLGIITQLGNIIARPKNILGHKQPKFVFYYISNC
eukprot:TRINITY_DN9734_c1_g1_i4.p6 TRINITY_DN9734_c1_g1~~TRINITY_DN9734_c1_g1_i4.p6  ORF type:complete len:106 (-),score=4.35 TRINITY_DN9734_c1_g1_i4:661-978(-)